MVSERSATMSEGSFPPLVKGGLGGGGQRAISHGVVNLNWGGPSAMNYGIITVVG